MKTFVTVLFAGVIAASGAVAQSRASDNNADSLNGLVLQALRVQSTAPQLNVVSAPTPTARSGLYVGGSVGYGGTSRDHAQWSNTLALGYEFNRYLALEASVDFNHRNSHYPTNGQTAFVNAIADLPLGRVSPYVLVGVGYGFNGSGNASRNPEALWNVGGGLMLEVTRSWAVDTRYRRVEGFNSERHGENVFSVGLNYRF